MKTNSSLPMIHYCFAFLAAALWSALVAFGGVSGIASEIARILFIVFVIFLAISMVRRS